MKFPLLFCLNFDVSFIAFSQLLKHIIGYYPLSPTKENKNFALKRKNSYIWKLKRFDAQNNDFQN